MLSLWLMFINLRSSPATGHLLCPSAGFEKTLPKNNTTRSTSSSPQTWQRTQSFCSAYSPCHLQLFRHKSCIFHWIIVISLSKAMWRNCNPLQTAVWADKMLENKANSKSCVNQCHFGLVSKCKYPAPRFCCKSVNWWSTSLFHNVVFCLFFKEHI